MTGLHRAVHGIAAGVSTLLSQSSRGDADFRVLLDMIAKNANRPEARNYARGLSAAQGFVSNARMLPARATNQLELAQIEISRIHDALSKVDPHGEDDS